MQPPRNIFNRPKSDPIDIKPETSKNEWIEETEKQIHDNGNTTVNQTGVEFHIFVL